MECYEKESWQKETEKRILDVIKGMGIDRMPSLSETKIFTGNTSLGNRIMKSGGFKHWASKLNVKIKKGNDVIFEEEKIDESKEIIANIPENGFYVLCITGKSANGSIKYPVSNNANDVVIADSLNPEDVIEEAENIEKSSKEQAIVISTVEDYLKNEYKDVIEEVKLTNSAYDNYFFVNYGNDLVLGSAEGSTWKIQGDHNVAPVVLTTARTILGVYGDYAYYAEENLKEEE